MRKLLPLILFVLAWPARRAARLRQRRTICRSRSPRPAKRPTKTASPPRATMSPSIRRHRHLRRSRQYNSATHDVKSKATSAFIAASHLYVGESATYNIDTKEIHARNMRGEYPTLLCRGRRNICSQRQRDDRKKRHASRRTIPPIRAFILRAQKRADLRKRSRRLSECHLLRRQGSDFLVALPLSITR